MAEQRDREHVGRPSSDAVKGEKAADRVQPTPSDKDDEVTPETIETDLLIEDRFEATDN